MILYGFFIVSFYLGFGFLGGGGWGGSFFVFVFFLFFLFFFCSLSNFQFKTVFVWFNGCCLRSVVWLILFLLTLHFLIIKHGNTTRQYFLFSLKKESYLRLKYLGYTDIKIIFKFTFSLTVTYSRWWLVVLETKFHVQRLLWYSSAQSDQRV